MVEPEELGLAYLQAAHVGGEGALNQYLDSVRGYLAEPRPFPMTQVGADRYLGSRTGSMVEALQVKNGQTAPFLDVIQGLGGE